MREALLGPSYFYHRRLIERSKTWSSEEIREYQEPRFSALIDRYGDAVREKDDYRRDLRRYTRWDVPLLTRAVWTSGTSGQTLRLKADTFARRQKERAYLFDAWSQVGFTPHALRVRYRGDMRFGPKPYFDRLENVWVVSPAATVDEQIGNLRSWLRGLPPFFFHVYPSSLFSFIDLVGEDLFRDLPVRGVLAGSEAFPVAERKRFEREFDIKIAHWYGHTEYATLAYCCRACDGFHFYPTYGYVELLPSEVEDCRRVVASSFNWLGTQFVRYDTGDLAETETGQCLADRFPRAANIVGRSQETFVDRSGRRRSLFDYAFADLDHGSFLDMVRDVQFVQNRPGFLLVRVVPAPEADKTKIERGFKHNFPVASLEFEYVPQIERSPSGKRKYFITTPFTL
jgi:phenylacetate-CoA ligase